MQVPLCIPIFSALLFQMISDEEGDLQFEALESQQSRSTSLTSSSGLHTTQVSGNTKFS